ncbi:hypothetical protein GCM10027167_81960 [Nocardia heshunensis]
MRSLWFIPQGNTVIEPEATTGYRGGWSSTLRPLTERQAAAVAAHGRRRAREIVSLLEGAGFVADATGAERWNETELVGEGFNRFDKGSNGRVHSVSARLALPETTPGIGELAARFTRLPDDVVERVRADKPDRTYTLFLPSRHGHAAQVTLAARDEPRRITATIVANSKPHFYRWDKRDSVWQMLRSGKTEDHDERRATELAHLGFSSRDWPVHAALPDGMPEQEATERVRLYLMGAGVGIAGAALDPRRGDGCWDVSISGDAALDTLGALRITDTGRISPPE